MECVDGKLSLKEKEELKRSMSQIFLDKRCCHCGKVFIVAGGWVEQYAYKKKVRGRRLYYCSYSCFNKSEIKASKQRIAR